MPALTPNSSSQFSPMPHSSPSHSHNRRPPTSTISLSSPSPSHIPGLDPRETLHPAGPGREDPASPRLRPQRGPGFRRTARKPLVRFPQTESHLSRRSSSQRSEERAGAPGRGRHKLHPLRSASSRTTTSGSQGAVSRPEATTVGRRAWARPLGSDWPPGRARGVAAWCWKPVLSSWVVR